MNTASLARPGRRLRVALAASLGLNLLLAGFLVTTTARQHFMERHDHGHEHGAGSGRSMHAMLERATAGLSAADAAPLEKAFQAHEPDMLAAHRAYETASDAVRDALAAEPFDLQKLRAAMQAANEARLRLGPIIGTVLLEAVPQMSQDGRVILSRNHAR